MRLDATALSSGGRSSTMSLPRSLVPVNEHLLPRPLSRFLPAHEDVFDARCKLEWIAVPDDDISLPPGLE